MAEHIHKPNKTGETSSSSVCIPQTSKADNTAPTLLHSSSLQVSQPLFPEEVLIQEAAEKGSIPQISQVEFDVSQVTPIQTRLHVSAPDDPLEDEADRVADNVLTMPDPSKLHNSNHNLGFAQRLQRQLGQQSSLSRPSQPSDRGDSSSHTSVRAYQRVALGQPAGDVNRSSNQNPTDIQMVFRRATVGDRVQPSGENLESRLHNSKGGGSPLPEETRSFMEPRFGADFSNVRVHTDSESVQMNQDLQAQAFTHQQDIYFGAGKFDPGSDSGKKLLAHELTHTIQQTGRIQQQAEEDTTNDKEEEELLQTKLLPNAASNLIQRKSVEQEQEEEEEETLQAKLLSNSPSTLIQREGAEQVQEEEEEELVQAQFISGGGRNLLQRRTIESPAAMEEPETDLDKTTPTSKDTSAPSQSQSVQSQTSSTDSETSERAVPTSAQDNLGQHSNSNTPAKTFDPQATLSQTNSPITAPQNKAINSLEASGGDQSPTTNLAPGSGQSQAMGSESPSDATNVNVATDGSEQSQAQVVGTNNLDTEQASDTSKEQTTSITQSASANTSSNAGPGSGSGVKDGSNAGSEKGASPAASGSQVALGDAPTIASKGDAAATESVTDTEAVGVQASSAAAVGATTPRSPEEDPAFQAVAQRGKQVAAQEKAHEPAATKASAAQAAAESPGNEVSSQAEARQVGVMEQAETPGFDGAAFKAQLLERIASIAPKTLEEADDFKKNNKLDAVKGDLNDQVKSEQDTSQGPLEEKAQETPDTSGIEPKAVTPLAPEEAGAEPGDIGAAQATPKPRGAAEVETPLQESSQSLDQQMAEANVTEEQLQNSNEPSFQAALGAKQEAQTHAATAPQAFRQTEEATLTQAQADSTALASEKLQGMHGDRAQLLSQVVGKQTGAKGKDEAARAKVANDIQGIYQQTKTRVEGILNSLDGEVSGAFDQGAGEAKRLFEDYVEQKMKAYKDKRYSGWLTGSGRWIRDKILGMPSEVNVFYEEGRQRYLDKMDAVLDNVVQIVGDRLTEAKDEVAAGRQKVQDYITQLPQDLQSVGQDAASEIQSEFDALEQSVDAKQDELIDSLAQKYQENLQAVDARIDEMKAANQGLVGKALNFVKGVIGTILKLKNMLLSVLGKAAGVIGLIIKDPIGFLGNLISGLRQGFENFVGNIWEHLQKGLIGWLTGSLGSAGIQIPDNLFSLMGIFTLVTQILGLTWNYIRGKGVKMFGERTVEAMEGSVPFIQAARDEGPKGLWEEVKDQFNDLKEMVIDQIKNMVITQVIQAGVKWILSLLNPASAFVKAAMAIYEIVMFFVNKGQQILEFVNSVIEAISAIAKGAVAGAAKLVENALVKSLPLIIGFLASVLSLGNLTKKVQNLIGKLRKRIDKAINKLLLKAKKLVKKLFKGEKTQKSHEADQSDNLTELPTVHFKDNTGENHKMWLSESGKSYKLMVASSNPQEVERAVQDGGEFEDVEVTEARKVAAEAKQIESLAQEADKVVPNNKKAKLISDIDSKIKGVTSILESSAEPIGNYLHAFGNKQQPRDPRSDKDIQVDSEGYVGPEPQPGESFPNGASTFGNPDKVNLTGPYHRIPKSVSMPTGLSVMADGRDVGGPHGETHHTIYPIEKMLFRKFVEKFQSLGWKYVGNKKK